MDNLTEYTSDYDGQDGFFNVIFRNGKLHALHWSGKFVVCDTIDPEVTLHDTSSFSCSQNSILWSSVLMWAYYYHARFTGIWNVVFT
jgi:hypothetical protein